MVVESISKTVASIYHGRIQYPGGEPKTDAPTGRKADPGADPGPGAGPGAGPATDLGTEPDTDPDSNPGTAGRSA
jgi:two-component system OmpR family sensor kinase